MKRKLIVLATIIGIVCFSFISCSNLTSSEPTYTVWTDIGTYSEFQSSFGTTLNDGEYLRLEFTSAQWNQIASSATSEGRHNWTKDQIKDWFLGRGFGNYEATKESSWMTTIEHGFIASRTGNTVYLIIK